MNIAWSYGVDFMEQGEDGKWIATFNTPEMVEALQYIKDLKWKYNALPDNSVVDHDELTMLFATNQAAMTFISLSNANGFSRQYGMPLEDIMMAKMPQEDIPRWEGML